MIRRRVLALAATLPLAVLAAGCSSGGEPAAGPGRITIGFSAWPGWFPWQVAAEQGLFTKHGLDVELKYFDSYTDSLTALSTGNLTANSQTLNDTLSSVSGGAQQTIVLVNDNSTGNDQIIAAPGINDVAGLKGKRVAVEQGTVDHYLLLLALEKAGLTQSDIELKPLLTDAAAAAFVAGQVDAVGVFAPFTSTALQLPGSKAIATSADFPGAIPDHLVFDAGFVRDHGDTVQAVVQTWFDTLAWIEANPDKATDIMAKRAGVSAADYRGYDAGTTIFSR
ncbi:MAG TPA: ABC transporter substrate-binding protein, partial [Micromonosporaceae bacterium]|nr:ABC transporter substrate-binding protein [Micromonosporaceae bacterium]